MDFWDANFLKKNRIFHSGQFLMHQKKISEYFATAEQTNRQIDTDTYAGALSEYIYTYISLSLPLKKQ